MAAVKKTWLGYRLSWLMFEHLGFVLSRLSTSGGCLSPSWGHDEQNSAHSSGNVANWEPEPLKRTIMYVFMHPCMCVCLCVWCR